MPYLKSAERKREIDNCLIGSHGSDGPNTPGELNYAMTILALRYLERGPINYDRMAEVESAFQMASKEFYRRVAAPYEDQKMHDNGDVF